MMYEPPLPRLFRREYYVYNETVTGFTALVNHAYAMIVLCEMVVDGLENVHADKMFRSTAEAKYEVWIQ